MKTEKKQNTAAELYGLRWYSGNQWVNENCRQIILPAVWRSVIIILLQQPLQSLQLALALQEQKHFQRFYRIFLMQFLFFVLLKIKSMINKAVGKIRPIPMPARILFPVFCVTRPTIAGRMLPPRSPAMASSANMAVPPVGNFCEEMLMVPGHIIPTEKPQIMQPTSPVNVEEDMEVRR